jgi:hypothetical protein
MKPELPRNMQQFWDCAIGKFADGIQGSPSIIRFKRHASKGRRMFSAAHTKQPTLAKRAQFPP